MSVWRAWRTYDYYGTPIRCVRRWFDGTLEMVDLVYAAHSTDGPDVLTRTARTLAPCVRPRVTDTLGGVTRPSACDHAWYGALIADAGPNAGLRCCSACGGAVG